MSFVLFRKYYLFMSILGVLVFVGCAQPEPTPTPVPTVTPRPTATATHTPQPTVTNTPTNTPTPAPLKPSEIFDKVSPSIAYIKTDLGSGSGILLEDGYILTNAHVIWPYEQARVYFPDGSEYEDVPVMNWDLIGDLAILGPIETDLEPLALVDGEDSIVGSDVYLIGYPGEVEDLPQPTITRGLISRFREWESIGVTYFQTDASIGGGQSGGALVSEMGEVIGISGNRFGEAGFGLAASAVDVLPRIEGVMAGDDVDQLGNRFFNMDNLPRTTTTARLRNRWEQRSFIIDANQDEDIDIEFDGQTTRLFIMDSLGRQVLFLDESSTGKHTVETAVPGPYFLSVFTTDNGIANISSNYELIRFDDPDENKSIRLNEPLFGSLDFPGDSDFFSISLKEGDIIHISVDSALVDPVVGVSFVGANDAQEVYDDDSGQGLFGVSAEMTYQAPQTGLYYIIVFDAEQAPNYGGYILSLREAVSDDPTPMAPKPTPTPIVSEFGEMALYKSAQYPFAMQYPAKFNENWVDTFGLTAVCAQATFCLVDNNGTLMIITEEDTSQIPFSIENQAEYVDFYISFLEETFEKIDIEHTTVTTLQGKTVDVVKYTIKDGSTEVIVVYRLIFFHNGIGFNATFVIDPLSIDEVMSNSIDYSFSTFRVE